MNTKNLLLAGIVGAIVNFFLGWLFYGIIFTDSFSQPDPGAQPMVMIFLGCLTGSLFIAYIFTKWAQISTAGTGFKAGAIIGLFMGLQFNFFNLMDASNSIQTAALDVVITIVLVAIVGGVIGATLGKLES